VILEVAILNVRTGQENDFERAFSQAQKIISSMSGYISLPYKNTPPIFALF